jgi:phosphoribosylaminoimidazolecarboxamide formyltransferase/IMP cyclohydrolase
MAEDLKKAYKTIVEEDFPDDMWIMFFYKWGKDSIIYEKVKWDIGGESKGLRYGENPSQEAALYCPINQNLVLGGSIDLQYGKYLVSSVELLQSGKHPGKINITDADNALNILRYLMKQPTVVIVKHNNPCGVAQADSLEEAYVKADEADRIAAFGGCIALNRSVDKATAEAIIERYAEVVVAPEFEAGVLDTFAKKKNLRVLQVPKIEQLEEFIGFQYLDFKSLIDGGLIVQKSFTPKTLSKDDLALASATYKSQDYTIAKEPTEKEIEDMLFGWWIELGISSNSVIYVKDKVTVGIGTGEQDRVGVAEIARDKAYRKMADLISFKEHNIPFHEIPSTPEGVEIRESIWDRVKSAQGGLPGSVMVSDAFFPFRDGVEVGLLEGVKAVIQPGGSERDHEVIEACNGFDATMVFTGQRCFKH